ncbi:MAG: ADP-heptose--LPS heptosyltransferase [Rhodospirillaceae bacterium]|nr:ADP-heptose--LPS heptosyltransferase [Rhodospirillaceae bacterium]|tara:strand:- start:269 stop:1231 length:963 start_codon:yes stop_codon:yes gene_type:complete
MAAPAIPPRNILVIKLGALGDFVQALGPMQAIRDHHAADRDGGAELHLLTAPAFVELAEASGLFDRVIPHKRMKWSQWSKIAEFRRELFAGNYARVYDLQTSDRSSFYFHLMGPGHKPEWSGIAKGCSHPHANPNRDRMHTVERQAEQLAMAGIEAAIPPSALSFADADLSRLALPSPYALLIPGGAPHRPGKRWPAERYADLAFRLSDKGLTPVLVGAADERPLHDEIIQAAPTARSLAGDTSLLELATLCRGAAMAVGNDTGPMHMAAISGIPTLVLYSHDSDPALCAQRGPAVSIVREPSLSDLSVDAVIAALPPHA